MDLALWRLGRRNKSQIAAAAITIPAAPAPTPMPACVPVPSVEAPVVVGSTVFVARVTGTIEDAEDGLDVCTGVLEEVLRLSEGSCAASS